MDFIKHSEIEGQHAWLSASNWHWLNYSNEKLITTYKKHLATLRGTTLHELAALAISTGTKLPKSRKTINMYVNDAIGFGMKPEQPLKYSNNCFGTADAICFKDNLLRIHDLKTGEIPAHMEQLKIYAALFCLEYQIKPGDISFELRIYQHNDIIIFNPTAEDILPVMDKIVTFNNLIEEIKKEELS